VLLATWHIHGTHFKEQALKMSLGASAVSLLSPKAICKIRWPVLLLRLFRGIKSVKQHNQAQDCEEGCWKRKTRNKMPFEVVTL
jgi:hypothetical protein